MGRVHNSHMQKAKFNVGDVVIHQRQGYRAVVIDVDLTFQPSGHYHPMASQRLLKRHHPWYRLLVDECSQETYVEETLLKQDATAIELDNPYIENYLILKKDKYYKLGNKH